MSFLSLEQLQAKALNLLAMREHSRFELHNKLKNHAQNLSVLTKLLDELEQNKYLSDERFIEDYIELRSEAGKGKLAIIAELNQRGISKHQAELALKNTDINWLSNVHKVWHHKFGVIPTDAKQYAKQVRFLLNRGFDYEDIKQVLKGKLEL